MKLRFWIVFLLLLIFAAARTEMSWPEPEGTKLTQAPPLPSHALWLNLPKGRPVPGFARKVTLIEFWDYSSVHSIRDIEYLKKWLSLYSPLGFQAVSVHAPDFDFGYKKENVERALKRLGVFWPVLMDNQFKTWKAYRVFSWPTRFLIDPGGRVIFTLRGEGEYRRTEEKIRLALISRNPRTRLPAFASPRELFDVFDSAVCGEMSDEIRVGTGKTDSLQKPAIANAEGFRSGRVVTYEDRGVRNLKGFFAHGAWRNFEDHFEHARSTASPEDYLGVNFEGAGVYSVLSSSHLEPVKFFVLLDSRPLEFRERGRDILTDGSGRTYVMAEEPRLYYLAENVAAGPHELKLYSGDEGASVYGFSFSNRCLGGFEKV